MRRELQTEQMRRRILDSALEVFGAEGYDGASMNAICTRAGISKGIIYHYFAGKEDLYLSCCRESTQKMADYLREHPVSGGTLRQQVGEFLALRHRFFGEYPRYEAVFYEVLFGHPLYLRPQLGEIRSRLEQVNLDFFRQTAGVSWERCRRIWTPASRSCFRGSGLAAGTDQRTRCRKDPSA